MRNVLIVDANALGMVAVIRSLGRAGYKTFAISGKNDAIGFSSTYASEYAINPPYSSESFIPWLKKFIKENAIELIMPSEGFLHAIQAHYQNFKPYIADAVSTDVWSLCMCKVDTQRCLEAHEGAKGLRGTRAHMPPGGVVRCLDDIDNISDKSQTPIYVKADHSMAKDSHHSAQVVCCETVMEAKRVLTNLLDDYDCLLWQEFVPGKKVGVSLWWHNGEFRAENMVLGLHTQPWTGGMMSLRETFWHEVILADAKEKMVALGWQGAAMMEYKWDPETDEFWLIEINARYWGYLHLDLYAQKDFPKLQADAFFGDLKENMGKPITTVQCRNTFPGEVGYLLSKLKSANAGFPSKIVSLIGFFARFLMPHIKSDLYFPGDRKLYFLSLKKFLLGK